MGRSLLRQRGRNFCGGEHFGFYDEVRTGFDRARDRVIRPRYLRRRFRSFDFDEDNHCSYRHNTYRPSVRGANQGQGDLSADGGALGLPLGRGSSRGERPSAEPTIVAALPISSELEQDRSAPGAVGWEFLFDDKNQRALEEFEAAHQIEPGDGSLLVGYALAAAKLDALEIGVVVMREALTIDPGALRDTAVNDRLQEQIKYLITRYKSLLNRTHGKDAAFMLAVLYDLSGDQKMAQFMIHRAFAYGDRGDVAIELEQRLHQNSLRSVDKRNGR